MPVQCRIRSACLYSVGLGAHACTVRAPQTIFIPYDKSDSCSAWQFDTKSQNVHIDVCTCSVVQLLDAGANFNVTMGLATKDYDIKRVLGYHQDSVVYHMAGENTFLGVSCSSVRVVGICLKAHSSLEMYVCMVFFVQTHAFVQT